MHTNRNILPEGRTPACTAALSLVRTFAPSRSQAVNRSLVSTFYRSFKSALLCLLGSVHSPLCTLNSALGSKHPLRNPKHNKNTVTLTPKPSSTFSLQVTYLAQHRKTPKTKNTVTLPATLGRRCPRQPSITGPNTLSLQKHTLTTSSTLPPCPSKISRCSLGRPCGILGLPFSTPLPVRAFALSPTVLPVFPAQPLAMPIFDLSKHGFLLSSAPLARFISASIPPASSQEEIFIRATPRLRAIWVLPVPSSAASAS